MASPFVSRYVFNPLILSDNPYAINLKITQIHFQDQKLTYHEHKMLMINPNQRK